MSWQTLCNASTAFANLITAHTAFQGCHTSMPSASIAECFATTSSSVRLLIGWIESNLQSCLHVCPSEGQLHKLTTGAVVSRLYNVQMQHLLLSGCAFSGDVLFSGMNPPTGNCFTYHVVFISQSRGPQQRNQAANSTSGSSLALQNKRARLPPPLLHTLPPHLPHCQ